MPSTMIIDSTQTETVSQCGYSVFIVIFVAHLLFFDSSNNIINMILYPRGRVFDLFLRKFYSFAYFFPNIIGTLNYLQNISICVFYNIHLEYFIIKILRKFSIILLEISK